MYTHPRNTFFHYEKAHHSEFCDVQLGSFPSTCKSVTYSGRGRYNLHLQCGAWVLVLDLEKC